MTITLYRSVSRAEFRDIMMSAIFQSGGSAPYETGKFFTTMGSYAVEWGDLLEGVGNFRVVEARFTDISIFSYWNKLDGIGPAYFGTFQQIGTPPISLWPGSPP